MWLKSEPVFFNNIFEAKPEIMRDEVPFVNIMASFVVAVVVRQQKWEVVENEIKHFHICRLDDRMLLGWSLTEREESQRL